ncbi:DUF2850 domain-containing protein [Vibrio algarum]|uniref:DUF2850 domain-containing protein n=1 Tax=Vibrio algarum TaxID=3020714 RepID=A0ABT4YNR2_9VIBR|nr:DUF2850 domain-containing protein [Vibrio sp. KJ40-1]MDB1123170.1 DUF2850 domain-containing protein [Vibrio sp. KJ40-1]
MAISDNNRLVKKQLRVKRAIIVVVSLLLIFIIGLSSVLVARYLDDSRLEGLIYGVWEEQNVPSFAQDRFEVREEAVYIEERIVDTRYTFDGSTLTYEFEGKIFEYIVLDEHVTELQRVAPTHYESVFHVRGKIKQIEEEFSDQ